MDSIKILVQLDSLYDTIVGTVHRYYPNLVSSLLCPKYLSRTSNRLSEIVPQIDDIVIAVGYDSRDVDTLRVSMSTNMVPELARYMNEKIGLTSIAGEDLSISLVINTYPYNLDKHIKRELFLALDEIIKPTKILAVHMSPADITPVYLKQHGYNQYIVNDFNEWLIGKEQITVDNPIPEITITAPLNVLVKGVPTDEIDNMPQQMLSTWMEFMEVDLTPLSLFSIQGGNNE